MSVVYFMSDPHWGHTNITKYRPFATAEEHDEVITDNVLSTLSKNDTLWILGDTCFTRPALEHLERVSGYVANVNLVLGNHCLQSGVQLADYKRLCKKVAAFTTYRNYWLSHCPIHPQEMRGRKGNIHGHLHGEVVMGMEGEEDQNYFCVSMEQIDYKPIPFKTIDGIMKEHI